jgi:hypothetical protein
MAGSIPKTGGRVNIAEHWRNRPWGRPTTRIWGIRLTIADYLGRGIGWLTRGGRLALLSLVAPAVVLLVFKVSGGRYSSATASC